MKKTVQWYFFMMFMAMEFLLIEIIACTERFARIFTSIIAKRDLEFPGLSQAHGCLMHELFIQQPCQPMKLNSSKTYSFFSLDEKRSKASCIFD